MYQRTHSSMMSASNERRRYMGSRAIGLVIRGPLGRGRILRERSGDAPEPFNASSLSIAHNSTRCRSASNGAGNASRGEDKPRRADRIELRAELEDGDEFLTCVLGRG